MTSKLEDLKKLIPAKLKPIYPLERKLLEGCVEGSTVSGEAKEKAKSEQKKNFIRGNFLSWLLGDKDANKFIHYTGIHIEDLLIDGQLLLERAVLEFPLRMKNCTFNTQINLNGAQVVILDLSGSQLEDGLTANFLKTQASIFLEKDFRSENGISLRGAEIFGNLNCEDAHFSAKKSDYQFTFDATLSNIRGNVSFRNSKHSNGAAYFENANIRGVFDCDNASFENYLSYNRDAEPLSLSLEGAKLAGGVLLRNKFRAIGAVRLLNAIILNALECDGGSFTTAKDNAILADGLTTTGSVFMRFGFSATGCVHLYGAKIGSEFDCQGSSFSPKNSENTLFEFNACFVGESMNVNGVFKWTDHIHPPKGYVSFQNASVKSYVDDEKSQPQKGMLNINGFTYDSFLHQEMYSAEKRLKWFDLQTKLFNGLQPYAQLIKVLRNAGYLEEAKKIAIKKEEKKSELLPLWRKRIRNLFLGATIDYGYAPQKVLFRFIIPIIIIGAFIFGIANDNGVMIQTKGDFINGQYPQFVPLAYSIDVFLPIVDLHQEEYWMPSIEAVKNSWEGTIAMNYMWIHIALGWLLTTLFVSAITGIIRTDVN